MSDTKWLELQHAINSFPFPSAYIIRCLTDTDTLDTTILVEPPVWHGRWLNYYDEGMPVLFNIEWLKIRPQLKQHKRRLVPYEVNR